MRKNALPADKRMDGDGDRVDRWFKRDGVNEVDRSKQDVKAFLDALVKRMETWPWKRCPTCGDEYAALRPSGECCTCDAPPPIASLQFKKKETIDDVLEVVDGRYGE